MAKAEIKSGVIGPSEEEIKSLTGKGSKEGLIPWIPKEWKKGVTTALGLATAGGAGAGVGIAAFNWYVEHHPAIVEPVSAAQIPPAPEIGVPSEVKIAPEYIIRVGETLVETPVAEIKVSQDWNEEANSLRENIRVGLERTEEILGPPLKSIEEKILYLVKLKEKRAGFAKDEQGNLWVFIAHPEDLRGLFHEIGHLWGLPNYGPGWSEGLAEFVSYQACGSWIESAPLSASQTEEEMMERWEPDYYHYSLAGRVWAELEREQPGFIKEWITWYHQELDAERSPTREEAVAAGAEIWNGFPIWVENQEILNILFDYTVQKGDTLSEIAQFYDTIVPELTRVNRIEDPNLIYEGQKITISRESKQTK